MKATAMGLLLLIPHVLNKLVRFAAEEELCTVYEWIHMRNTRVDKSLVDVHREIRLLNVCGYGEGDAASTGSRGWVGDVAWWVGYTV